MSRRRQLYDLVDNIDRRPNAAKLMLVNIPPAILMNLYAGSLCTIANAALLEQYVQMRNEFSLYNITDNA